jgi:hypothetical protein
VGLRSLPAVAGSPTGAGGEISLGSARHPTPVIHASFQNFSAPSSSSLRETLRSILSVRTLFEWHFRSNEEHVNAFSLERNVHVNEPAGMRIDLKEIPVYRKPQG